jgi:RNA-binding protein YlmH
MYFIQKNLTRLKNGQSTFFLDPNELKQVRSKLKANDYSIYYPYKDSEKNIIYNRNIPEVLLYEIKIKVPVRHQDILGSIYSLNISHELFGDILIIDNRYFIYILPIIRNYFESNFLMVKNSYIELEELDINYLNDYERSYEKLEIIVSSNRIDTVVSKLCNTGRNNISEMIKKKEILLNYDFLKNNSYKLKDGDTFSIRRIGKFKYNGVIKNTKSNNLIIEILKYI